MNETEKMAQAARMLADGGTLLVHSKGDARKMRRALKRLVPAMVRPLLVPKGTIYVLARSLLEPMDLMSWKRPPIPMTRPWDLQLSPSAFLLTGCC